VEADQIAELKAWGARLEERSSSDETKAAGKAIAMLAGEVEALNKRLAAAERAAAPEAPAAPAEAEPPGDQEPAWAEADDRLRGSFFTRLKRTFGFD
jgi:hypothetical protein